MNQDIDKTTHESQAQLDGFITKDDVARRLKRSIRTIENWQRQGIIPFVKIGHSVLFNWPDVQTHVQAHFRICRPKLAKLP